MSLIFAALPTDNDGYSKFFFLQYLLNKNIKNMDYSGGKNMLRDPVDVVDPEVLFGCKNETYNLSILDL
jgi:hypothetical protein